MSPATSLALAGGLMILAGLSVVGLAVAVPRGASLLLSSETVGGLLFGVVLIAAGVETIRRRHFWFAVLVPAFLALASAGYGIATGQAMVIATVSIYVLAVLLVVSSRHAFAAGGQTQS